MDIPLLNIHTSRSIKDKLRLCFWLYLFLLIFEGAFRKWILPEASNLFLVIRDPIVIYVLFIGVSYNLLTNFYAKFFIFISLISLLLTLTVGHQNIIAAAFGIRIYCFHIPAMFIWGKSLNRMDIKKIGIFVLYTSAIMCPIIVAQYLTPQSSWINLGIGGTGSSGFGGVGNYYRPSGTFSFITGMIGFEFLVGSYLFYFLYQKHKTLNKYQLGFFLTLYIISVFICLSRSVIVSSCALIITAVASSIISGRRIGKSLLLILSLSAAFIMFYSFIPVFQLAVNNMLLRFDAAAYSEGNFIHDSMGNRIGGSFFRAFFETQNFTHKEIPTFGFGMGAGSKIGTIALGLSQKNSFGLAEEEWSLVICEYGYYIGGLLLIVGRLIFPLLYAIKATLLLKKNGDILPFIFIPSFVASFTCFGFSVSTTLGFVAISGSIILAAIRTNPITKNRKQYLRRQTTINILTHINKKRFKV